MRMYSCRLTAQAGVALLLGPQQHAPQAAPFLLPLLSPRLLHRIGAQQHTDTFFPAREPILPVLVRQLPASLGLHLASHSTELASIRGGLSIELRGLGGQSPRSRALSLGGCASEGRAAVRVMLPVLRL